jgi:predicted dehydrogenase
MSRNSSISRRRLIQSGALAAASASLVRPMRGWGQAESPAEKLNVAMIGSGGKGGDNIRGVLGAGCNIVALCDIDEGHLNGAKESVAKQTEGKMSPRTWIDYRKMLEGQKDIDAVVTTIADHSHAHASVMAMRLGKHCYCEKPLTHSVYEARLMRETVAKQKVATQMGNAGHSRDALRMTVEWIQAGVIGPVREVHVWTDRAENWWPQGVARPTETPRVPKHLNWDLWLGPAPERPYHPAYHPFKWRGWVDFGTGALGDMGCHNIDAAFWALELEDPATVEAETSEFNGETYPAWSIVRWEFDQRGSRPPVKLTWYDGGKLPPRPEELEAERQWKPDMNATLFVGEKGKLLTGRGGPRLIPEERMKDFKKPEETIPRSIGHYKEWVEACKGGKPAMSNFEYAARLTETVLLGNVAIRAGKKIEWDAEKAKVTNLANADHLIKPAYRKGWEL